MKTAAPMMLAAMTTTTTVTTTTVTTTTFVVGVADLTHFLPLFVKSFEFDCYMVGRSP